MKDGLIDGLNRILSTFVGREVSYVCGGELTGSILSIGIGNELELMDERGQKYDRAELTIFIEDACWRLSSCNRIDVISEDKLGFGSNEVQILQSLKGDCLAFANVSDDVHDLDLAFVSGKKLKVFAFWRPDCNHSANLEDKSARIYSVADLISRYTVKFIGNELILEMSSESVE